MAEIEVGLIGSGIGRSMAPMLHETLGALTGRPLRYHLHELDPGAGPDLPAVLHALAERGLIGVNITHPFKEQAIHSVTVEDPIVLAMGAVNTIRFDADRPRGFNTDYTGLLAAYRARFAGRSPGTVCLLGAGGVGKATAFALASLGTDAIRLFDPDNDKARLLARQIAGACDAAVGVYETAGMAASGADGIVNCSPIGMYTHPGCPVDPSAFSGIGWAFDAVYSPIRTDFLAHAEAAGAEIMTGVDLFFRQGLNAFEVFHSIVLDDEVIEAARLVIAHEVDRRSTADGALGHDVDSL